MTWIKDAYGSIKGETELAWEGCCTGKMISQGGISGRTESTGLGVYFCVKALVKNKAFIEKSNLGMMGLKGKKFVIQGFGNVGYWAAKYF
jgi:glutamate dehydrogenase (NAD(P)+)